VFDRKKEDEAHPLDESIRYLISEIEGMSDNAENQRTNAVESLRILMELRNADKAEKRKLPVSPDVLTAAGAHILGIAMILGFEKRNVLTSKAMQFVPKIRI
jgi:hypothetical protein